MVMGEKQIIILPEIGSIFHLPTPGRMRWLGRRRRRHLEKNSTHPPVPVWGSVRQKPPHPIPCCSSIISVVLLLLLCLAKWLCNLQVGTEPENNPIFGDEFEQYILR